ncbi:hypothetical protein Hanom_Chr13g01206331 [Helianthus anomalus]
MTYGPKNDKSSVNNGFVEEKVDLKFEDTLGGEQALNSDLPKNCFDETNSELVLGQSIFSMFASLASNGPDVLGKTDDGCVESSVSLGVLNVESSGTPLETVDTCVAETCVNEISNSSETKTKSESIEKETNVEINKQSSTNVFENKTETEPPTFQHDDDHSKKNESHSPSTSHACANSNQQGPNYSKQKQAKQARQVKKIRNDTLKTQNTHTLKRKTFFNYGIVGHIARNCANLPRMKSKYKSFKNQKAKPNRCCYSEPVKAAKTEAMKNNNRKAKPSDCD